MLPVITPLRSCIKLQNLFCILCWIISAYTTRVLAVEEIIEASTCAERVLKIFGRVNYDSGGLNREHHPSTENMGVLS